MKDNFESKLVQVRKALHGYTPDENLWEKISDWLDFDETLKIKAKESTWVNYSPDLWANIEKGIVPHVQLKRKRIYLSVTSLSAAVTLLLIISFYLFKNQANTKTLYSEEYIVSEPCQITQGVDNPADFLQKWCARSANNCSDPVTSFKMQKIDELNAEIRRINNIMLNYGESSSLIKTLIKMENQRAGLIKDVLKTIRS